MQPLNGMVCVVIDADAANAKLAGLHLTQAGAVVTIALDANQALKAIDAKRPRVVILDLHLPEVSGLVLARMISQLAWAKDTRIIAVSTGNGASLRSDAIAYGCADYVEKPLNDTRLIDAVVRSLGGT